MNKRLWYLMVAGALVSVQGYAAKEKVINFTNHVRLGYDDNIDMNAAETDTGYLTNISQLTGKMVFSSRSELMLFWQPEFRYRFDADPKFVTYQDIYGRLDHAMSQRLFLTLSDRLSYQDRDGQKGTGAPGTSDQNYLDNDLQGALTFAATGKSDVKLGAGYFLRRWDDDQYGKVDGNNFDRVSGDVSYIRQFFSEKSDLVVMIQGADLSYDADRGGYTSIAGILGVDQTFSSSLSAYAHVGLQSYEVENNTGATSDSVSPYLQGGFDYQLSDRTSLNGSLGYSLTESDNSAYNAQNNLRLGLGARHDITSKINLAANFTYSFSQYDVDYSSGINIPGFTPQDLDDNYVQLALRGTYQLNRNNFLELGYIWSKRTIDELTQVEYDRNRIEMGWKLKL